MVALLGCSSGSIVQDKFTIDDAEWHMDEVFTSQFVVTDTLTPYDFFLNVRNGGNYPYANLHVFVTTMYPNGKKAIDTVNCPLADKQGRWLGSGLGDVLDSRILYRYNKPFPMSGKYTITLQHAMRDTLLPAILNMGLSIEKTTD